MIIHQLNKDVILHFFLKKIVCSDTKSLAKCTRKVEDLCVISKKRAFRCGYGHERNSVSIRDVSQNQDGGPHKIFLENN